MHKLPIIIIVSQASPSRKKSEGSGDLRRLCKLIVAKEFITWAPPHITTHPPHNYKLDYSIAI